MHFSQASLTTDPVHPPNPNQCQTCSTSNYQTKANSNPQSKPKFNEPNYQSSSTTTMQHPCNPILPIPAETLHTINLTNEIQVCIDSNNPHPVEHLYLQVAAIKSILDNMNQQLNEKLFTRTTNTMATSLLKQHPSPDPAPIYYL